MGGQRMPWQRGDRPAWWVPLLCLCLALPIPGWGRDLVLLLSHETAPYTTLADRLVAALEQGPPGPWVVRRLSLDQATADRLTALPADALILAIGARATGTAFGAAGRHEVLAILVPRQFVLQQLGERPPPADAGHTLRHSLCLDQPPSRLLELLVAALPERRHPGVLLGPHNGIEEGPLQRAAARLGLTLRVRRAGRNEKPVHALAGLLETIDSLVALPDPRVVNRQTLPAILLTSYRYRIPVIGFSRAQLRAGALLALYTAIDDILADTLDALRALQHHRAPPADCHPRHFHVGVNRRVARSLDIALPTEDDLHRAIETLERKSP